MLWDEKYKQQQGNKTFSKLRDNLVDATTAALLCLKNESGGLNNKERAHADRRLEEMRARIFNDQPVDVMTVISMSVDLLNSILNRVKPGSAKYTATINVWYKIRAFERYFDRNKKYEDPDGLEAAETYKQIMAEV